MIKRIRRALSTACALLAWPLSKLADILYVPAVPPPELKLHHFAYREGHWDFTVTMRRDHPGLMALAEEAADLFHKQGGVNYLCIDPWDARHDKVYRITITPNLEGEQALHRVNGELKRRIAELEAQLVTPEQFGEAAP